MPDVDGKLILDADGREILNDDGTEACECCAPCVCPVDVASSYTITGHIKSVDALGATVCDEDFTATVTVTEDGSCSWQGDIIGLCGGGDAALSLGTAGPSGGGCRFVVFFDFAVALSDGRLFAVGPAGAYPDVTVVSGGNTITFSSILVS